MIKVKVDFDVRLAMAASAQLSRRTPIITAQELNRQRRRSRTLLVRAYARKFQISPQRRIRKRILLPRGGLARPFRLRALGLSLVEQMPARWFARDPSTALRRPAGITVMNDRPTQGQAFWATVKGNRGLYRRRRPSKPRTFQKGNAPPPQLPIDQMQMRTGLAGYRIRDRVLKDLAKEWPDVWQARMRREIDRTF